MPILFDLKKFPNKYFIETGTYMGDGVNKALETEAFTYIYSIEIDTLRHLTCKESFSIYDNITLIKGDSAILLKLVLKHIKEPCTFWLDAHFCGDEGEIGTKWCPLVEELEAIKNHPIKNHTIIVDDYRCMDNTHFDKERNIPVGFPGKKKLLEILQSINPDYSIKFLDGVQPKDVVVASVDFADIAKETIDGIIDTIEYEEALEIKHKEFVEDILRQSVYELENEGKEYATSIIYDMVHNIEQLSKDLKEKQIKEKEIYLEKFKQTLIEKEIQLNNERKQFEIEKKQYKKKPKFEPRKRKEKIPIMSEELKIIEEKLHQMDEDINKRLEFIKDKEILLDKKEEELNIKQETIQEIIIDLHLQKDIKRFDTLEKKATSRNIRKNRRKRKKH